MMTSCLEEKIHSSLRRTVGSRALSILDKAAEEGELKGIRVFLVGGAVRDMLLGRKTSDLDIVTEGDASALARSLSSDGVSGIREYGRFGTAKVTVGRRSFFAPWERDFVIDIAMAREEDYVSCGALPRVRPSTLRHDLLRRDFTVNAMAMGLNGNDAGEIVDVSSGLSDLKNKLLRVLHDKSFMDDPARIFRAARFAARLSFGIEGNTSELLKKAVKGGALRCMRKSKIVNEWSLLVAEKKRRECMAILESLLGEEMEFLEKVIRERKRS
ncbi:MAG TPA: hypothetical protein PKZ41_03755 [Candidatus Omnitrophota bacterium]|nr:hypothetical protein [Candidatus Omnitrophota bacterium]